MFVAHLPAGYLIGKAAQARDENGHRRLLFAALLGSVLPDFDLLYFYLIDGQSTLHHNYFTHLPFFWLCVSPFLLPSRTGRVFLVSIALHLLLDTWAGGIAWKWPFSKELLVCVTVPAAYDWWVWNFALHWSFLPEIALVGAAFWKWKVRV